MICLEVVPDKLSQVLERLESAIVELDDKLRFKVMLVSEEIITNQIRHTDFENRVPYIEVCIDISVGDGVVMLFRDNAKRFDPLEMEEPDITKSIDDTELGGLGIFMVKGYSREIEFEYRDGFNILKVVL